MGLKLRPINQQVIVITGASSGIGLATAMLAAERGARVVLSSRNEDALADTVRQINRNGGEAIYFCADVGKRSDVESLARAAFEHFGHFDTWVNNAGVGIWGRLEQVSDEDNRRLFDTNFWGVVYGSLIAADHLKQRGGAIVNLGSVESDMVMPLQGVYAASKHAVKAFTDVLRLELEEERAPVSLTVIKPGAIATPMPQHMKNYMDREGQWAPPIYNPYDVAEAILHAASHSVRDLHVGSSSKAFSLISKHLPRALDKFEEKTMFRAQQKDTPAQRNGDNLHKAGRDGLVFGDHSGHTVRHSMYTKAAMHPLVTGAVIAGAVIAGLWYIGKQFFGELESALASEGEKDYAPAIADRELAAQRELRMGAEGT